MTWSAVPTFNVGDILTAANMNIIGGDVNLLGSSIGASVLTSETTASTSYVDLATVGPKVTLTTLTTAIVIIGSTMANSSNVTFCLTGFAISGATTVAASDNQCVVYNDINAGVNGAFANVFFVSGLTAGSNTFTEQYRVTAGTGTFLRRNIAVIPLSV